MPGRSPGTLQPRSQGSSRAATAVLKTKKKQNKNNKQQKKKQFNSFLPPTGDKSQLSVMGEVGVVCFVLFSHHHGPILDDYGDFQVKG